MSAVEFIGDSLVEYPSKYDHPNDLGADFELAYSPVIPGTVKVYFLQGQDQAFLYAADARQSGMLRRALEDESVVGVVNYEHGYVSLEFIPPGVLVRVVYLSDKYWFSKIFAAVAHGIYLTMKESINDSA